MAEKQIEAVSGCWAKAADDEPVFVLRAQDRLAPSIVRLWASLAREHGCGDAKTGEALALAERMEKWPRRKLPD